MTSDEAFARHRQALKLAARGQDPRDGGWTAGQQAVAADAARPAERRAGRRVPRPQRDLGRQARRDTDRERRAVPRRERGDRLPPAAGHLHRDRPGRHRRARDRGHRLGRGRLRPALLRQGADGGGVADAAAPGGAAAGAVAGALRPGRAEHAPAALRGSLWLYYTYGGPSRWQTTTGVSTQQLWAAGTG